MAVLAFGLVEGCGSDGGGGKDPDAGEQGDATDTDTNPVEKDDAGIDGGPDDDADAEPCESTVGCDDLGAECGNPVDNCGEPLDCGNDCTDPDNPDSEYYTCGGGGEEYKCGCTPKTCDTIAGDGLSACGTEVSDGCGGIIEGGCGDCGELEGEGWLCNTAASVCECSPRTKEQACAALGRACGMATDGCGGTEYSCGACTEAQTCGGDGTCACKPQNDAYAAVACAGKTCGTVVVDGCTFSCGAAECSGACATDGSCASCTCAGGQVCNPGAVQCCTPATTPAAIAALCTGTCGQTVTDPCTGASVTCGCAAGQGCVDKAYVEGATQNVCLPANEASALGGYVVRSHNFSSVGTLSGIERAESVFLIKVVKKANGTFQLQDSPCVATTAPTKTVLPAYFQGSTTAAQLVLNGQAWRRETPAVPLAAGFEPGMPSFCAAHPGGTPDAAPDYDTEPSDLDPRPTASSGSQKAWLDGPCTCPEEPGGAPCSRTNMRDECLPRERFTSHATATDCRINDVDRDGRPGLTIVAELGPVATIGSMADAVAYGTLSPDGSHIGISIEPTTVYRHFFSCEGLFCSLLGNAGTSHICGNDGNKYNRTEYRKLSPSAFATMSCAEFYNGNLSTIAAADSWSDVRSAVKQTAVDSYFNGADPRFPLAACTSGATCPEGSICHSGKCWPMTSAGSCSDEAECNNNPKNAVAAGWTCAAIDPASAARSCRPKSCPALTGAPNPG